MDVDPLSYEYAQYEYPQMPIQNQYYNPNLKNENLPHYQYNQIPYEPALPLNDNQQLNTSLDNNYINDQQVYDQENIETEANQNEPEDIKPDINELNKKKRSRRSSYWNIKVKDKNFAFYGCAICNVSYTELEELDKHVSTHKDRITTYGLRVHNQKKKKQLKKEMKRMKKVKMEKKEIKSEVEIKPEDGYIGNQKAADVNLADGLENNLIVNNENLNKDAESNVKAIDSDSVKNNDSNVMKDNVDSKESKKSSKKKSKSENADKEKQDNLQKIYKCFACQKQFLLSYYLRLHVRSHTGNFSKCI